MTDSFPTSDVLSSPLAVQLDDFRESEMLVHGSLMVGFAQSCVNLNIVAGQTATQFIRGLQHNEWYRLSDWEALQQLVVKSYTNVDPIMMKVGIAMMMGWYHYGPGKEHIKRGAAFLHYQTGSGGFASVVRGPEEKVGSFELELFDKQAGRAIVRSTTPFNRTMECGVLIGGMLAPGDIDYVDVSNANHPDYLVVEFH